ncbi:lysophospholipid acyltransferase family protein, partial [Planktomarina temperata]|nr:lysophospholipid acyltransferase family protein [Planktomarina temperata]
VYPDMPRRERLDLCRNMGRNMGRTLYEILHCSEFQTLHHRNTVSGPGLEALQKAHAEGKGAIIVSGHFGQWEAVRSTLKSLGLETGAVYRPQTNRHYERRLYSGIAAGGQPILATGKIGTRALVRHVQSGGFIAILLDEKYPYGDRPKVACRVARSRSKIGDRNAQNEDQVERKKALQGVSDR